MAVMTWITTVALTCGCRKTIDQPGSEPCPDPGEGWICDHHGETEVFKVWRRSK